MPAKIQRGLVISVVACGIALAGCSHQTQQQKFVDASPYAGEMHGTAVAGIIAAKADNGLGIVGIAPRARLMALRACWQIDDGAAQCDSFSLAKALQYALSNGAQVINLSLTGPADRLLAALLDVAGARGIAVVGAADPLSAAGGFPASHPSVIAVAASATDAPANVVLAPGTEVPTTLPGGRWGFVQGTSFAAAHVSGMLALLRELDPGMSPVIARSTLLAATAREPGHGVRTDACTVVVHAARADRACPCNCPVNAAVGAISRR